MKKVVCLAMVFMLMLSNSAAFAAGKATITQEAFHITPFLDYFAGEIFCEVTNTGDRPVTIESGVYEFFDTEGESIDSGSIYWFYPRTLLPGEKGYLSVTSGIEEAIEPTFIDDYSVSIVGKSANEEDVIRYPVSDVRMGEYDDYGWYQAFYATVNNDSDVKTGDVSVVFAAYDDEGNLLFNCAQSTSGMALIPGNSVEVHRILDSDIISGLEQEGKEIATITALAYEE